MGFRERTRFLKRPCGRIAALILVPVAAAILAACGNGGGGSMGNGSMGGGMMAGGLAGAPAGAILVRLSNWSVDPAQPSAQAGAVTFRAVHDMHDMHSNGEGKTHELVVARKNADGSFEVIGEAQAIGIGEHKDLTLQLVKGDYELQCNIVEEVNGKTVAHYKNGMHTPFTVT